MIKLNYEHSMIQSFEDAMTKMTRQEREEYDMIHHREQDNWWWHQNLEDENDGHE